MIKLDVRKTIARGLLSIIVALVLAGLVASLLGCDGGLDCKPDLRVESISVEQPVTPWEPAAVSVTIWNRGVARASQLRVVLYSDGGTGYDWIIGGVGEREYRTLNGWLIIPDNCALSTVDVTVIADLDDFVIESDETNNSLTVSVVVGAVAEVTP